MSGTLTTPESTGVGALLDSNGQPYPIQVQSSAPGGGLPAPGTPAYNPAWYALTAIFWDPAGTQGGSDANSGATIGAPVKTFAEIVRRYGSNQPTFNYGQSVTIDQLTAQPLGQDPVFFEPRVTNGGQAILNVVPVAFGALATIAVSTAKVRGAPGTLLTLTLASCPAGVAAGMLAVNATRNSQALVDSVGATVVMQQPQTIASLGSTATVPNPVEDDTWSTGDQVQFYTLQNCNLKRWSPAGGDETAASQPSGGWVFTASIADPSGTGASAYFLKCESACNVLVSCLINGRVDLTSLGGRGTANTVVAGCSVLGQCLMVSGQVGIYGGASGSAQSNANAIITNDHIAHGSINQVGGLLTLGNVYCTGTITASGGTILQGGFVWGSWAPNVDPGTRWWNNAGGWAATCLTANNFQIGGVSSGSGFTVATGVWSAGAISPITPAALDAAAGTAIVSPLTGAGYSKGF